MKKIDTLTIIGVGLIGGSIARAVKKKKLAQKIIGFGRRRSSLNKALRAKAVDEITTSLPQAVKNADVIIIATPVGKIAGFIRKCQRHCKPGCIITDVGSTKSEILKVADKVVGQDKFFVGAHPMAGSEKRSFEFSRGNLFIDSVCFLTKNKKTNKKALRAIELFWKQLGAQTIVISSAKHDKIVAEISHLPHAIATSLTNCSRGNVKFAGNSFRDTTRIASSDVNMWLDIFLSNPNNVITSIDKFIKNLQKFKSKVKNRKKSELRKELERAKLVREKIVKSER